MNKVSIRRCPQCGVTTEISDWCNKCLPCFSDPIISEVVNVLRPFVVHSKENGV